MKSNKDNARAPKGRRRAQHARARGLRTLQHQRLSVLTRRGIDTEAWFRSLIAERRGSGGARASWSTKDQIHDEAIAWFLEQRQRRRRRIRRSAGARGGGNGIASGAASDYPARRGAAEDLTFWIDSRLLERARRAAAQDGVRLAQLIDAALSGYVRERVPGELLAFRRRVQSQAWRMYQARRTHGTASTRSRFLRGR